MGKINLDRMFSGDLFFLSNMYPCNVQLDIDGKTYRFQSSEAAFQAGKCTDPREIRQFETLRDGKAAKRLGRKIALRPDWNIYRIQWMQKVVAAKFQQNPELMQKLKETGDMPLVETNTWGDTFWGVSNGKGKNHLGRILMEIRGNHI